MTKLEILKRLRFDKAAVSFNPYYFSNDYEEKGVLVLYKIREGSDLDYQEIDNLCFQCAEIITHDDLVSMVLFLFDKDDIIYNYNIAASKYKVSRNDIVMFEELLGEKIDWGESHVKITKHIQVL